MPSFRPGGKQDTGLRRSYFVVRKNEGYMQTQRNLSENSEGDATKGGIEMNLKIVGALMLAAFVIVLFLVVASCTGIRDTLLIFGVAIISAVWVVVATCFLSS